MITQTDAHARSVQYCPKNHTHCLSLFPNVRPHLSAFRAVHTIYVGLHVGSTARNHVGSTAATRLLFYVFFLSRTARNHGVVRATHTHTQRHAPFCHMVAQMHLLNTQRPTSAPQRTSSAWLAASGYACSRASTTSGLGVFMTT